MPCRRPVRVPTDQEKLTCNSHQFQESRRFVILIANLFLHLLHSLHLLSSLASVIQLLRCAKCAEPKLRAADHLGKHHKPPIPHDLGLYRASAAPAEGKLYLQADDRCGELHLAPYLRTDHRGKMAEALFMSRPYLSRKFKEETGESLTDFILYEKRRRQNASSAIPISPLRPSALILVFLLPATFPGCSKPVCALRRACTGKSTSGPAGLYFACAPSGKMILFTKKKITMEMPPLSTVVPML